jgi:Icc-related predicted phosphoesterase
LGVGTNPTNCCPNKTWGNDPPFEIIAMKINYCSDIHLEHAPLSLPGGDILILAGDICEARRLVKQYENNNKNIKNDDTRYYDFFYKECSKYEKVIYVMGNHEHWGGRFDKTYMLLSEVLPNNVTLLEKEFIEINGVILAGTTLWTDLNKRDPLTVYQIKDIMNDYKEITNHKKPDWYGKIKPTDILNEHSYCLESLKKIIDANSDKPVIVITHHAPTFKSVHEHYINDYHGNGAYVSELSNFILERPNIQYWIHGHVHNEFDYQVGVARVLCYPRGYVGFERGRDYVFEPKFLTEISTT